MKTKFDIGEVVFIPVIVQGIKISKSEILYDLYCGYNIQNSYVPENFIVRADIKDEQQT